MTEIHGLPVEQCAFVKKITLSKKNTENIFLATIAYARNPRDGHYKMHPINMNRMDRCIYGNKEEEYPIDELDQAILDALRTTFQDVEPHTSFQMFDNQQEDNRRFVHSREKGTIRININIMLPNWESWIVQTDKEVGFSMDVYVYSYSQKDIEQFANRVCNVYVSNDVFAQIKQQVTSFHALDEIV